MLRDLRHAVRVLFSAVNGLFLKPIPVTDPHELVRLRWTGDNDAARNVMANGYTGRGVSGSFSFAVFEALRDANDTLSGMFAGASTPRLNLVIGGLAEVGSGYAASGDYFRILGIRAAAGRVLLPDDDRAGAEPVAMISHRFWERRFGLDPAAVGTVIAINDVPTTIVGVLPSGFTGIARATDDPVDVHIPLQAFKGGPLGADLLSDPTFRSVIQTTPTAVTFAVRTTGSGTSGCTRWRTPCSEDLPPCSLPSDSSGWRPTT